ncbi:MAG: TAXI family TRAP transporter solute-binding subunit [Actinomycetota bacterium]|nr:TAXI family TRAP transporter solute-binding subunit [Actinomycetota bacterium]
MSDDSRRSITFRRRLLAAGAAAGALLVGGCGGGGLTGGGGGGGGAGGAGAGGGGGGGTALSIATGGTGGVYYPLGGGIANVIGGNVPGYTATVQETNASVDNMRLVQSGQAALAFGVGDVVADAAKGTGEFDQPLDICAIGNTYNNFMQPITVKGTGIESIEDMRGKRISVGAPGSATEVLAARLLEAAGIDPNKDIKRAQLGAAETVDALRDKTIDAGFWSGGLPTGALVDLASSGELVIIPHAEYEGELQSKFGDYYFARDIPAGTYQGQDEAVSVIASPNILVASKKMPEDLQRRITQAIFDNKQKLVQVHPAAKELDKGTASDIEFINTCPGAKAYFDQAGS